MYCKNCGKEINSTNNVCQFCGNSTNININNETELISNSDNKNIKFDEIATTFIKGKNPVFSTIIIITISFLIIVLGIKIGLNGYLVIILGLLFYCVMGHYFIERKVKIDNPVEISFYNDYLVIYISYLKSQCLLKIYGTYEERNYKYDKQNGLSPVAEPLITKKYTKCFYIADNQNIDIIREIEVNTNIIVKEGL
jgi:hypothetical protein